MGIEPWIQSTLSPKAGNGEPATLALRLPALATENALARGLHRQFYERNFHHAALLIEDPVLAEGLRLSDTLSIIARVDEIRSENFRQEGWPVTHRGITLDEPGFGKRVTTAANRLGELLRQRLIDRVPSIEEQFCIIGLRESSEMNPFSSPENNRRPSGRKFFVGQGDTCQFLLNATLLTPRADTISWRALLAPVRLNLPQNIGTSVAESDFRIRFEQLLAYYNSVAAIASLGYDMNRGGQLIDESARVSALKGFFKPDTATIKGLCEASNTYGSATQDPFINRVTHIVESSQHNFRCMEYDWVFLDTVRTISREYLNDSSRREWWKALQQREPLSYVSINKKHWDSNIWPLSPFAQSIRALALREKI